MDNLIFKIRFSDSEACNKFIDKPFCIWDFLPTSIDKCPEIENAKARGKRSRQEYEERVRSGVLSKEELQTYSLKILVSERATKYVLFYFSQGSPRLHSLDLVEYIFFTCASVKRYEGLEVIKKEGKKDCNLCSFVVETDGRAGGQLLFNALELVLAKVQLWGPKIKFITQEVFENIEKGDYILNE